MSSDPSQINTGICQTSFLSLYHPKAGSNIKSHAEGIRYIILTMQYRNINMYRMLIPKTVVNYYDEKVKDHNITILKHDHRVYNLLQDVF